VLKRSKKKGVDVGMLKEDGIPGDMHNEFMLWSKADSAKGPEETRPRSANSRKDRTGEERGDSPLGTQKSLRSNSVHIR